MRVSKWGNSLAVRLPASVVEALQLAEGDELTIEVGADNRALSVERDRTREEALARLASLGWKLPPGFRFSRDEANARGPLDDE